MVDPRPPPTALDTGGSHWIFKTNDCRKDFETLKARGVGFKTPDPVEAPFGIAAYFTDPDNNDITLLEPSTKVPRKARCTSEGIFLLS